MDYRDTLNLPQTDFPMRADLPTREPQIAKLWEAHDTYHKTAHRPGSDTFILHDGPPYSNGDIHMGTALNKTLKDFIVKYKAMRGFAAPYVPGWDNHGLPIEVNVMKEFRKNGKTPDKVTLRRRCREYAQEFVDRQRGQFQRLGVRGDWENPYLTMSREFEAEIVKVFGEMAEKGFVYRGLKPVQWCVTDETALADAELEYKNVTDTAIYVRFPLKSDPHGVFPAGVPAERCFTVIWTTTPWTIPANVAVAVSPTFDYAVAKTEAGDYYVVAEGLLEKTMQVAGVESYEIVRTVVGRELSGMVFRHPLFERDSVLVHADYVTLDAGTGVVHTAPGHGKEDFETGQVYDLPVLQPVESNGVYDETAGEPFVGLHVFKEGNARVVEELANAGNLLARQDYPHSYPHCWRCNNPVLFRSTVQWFMSIDHADHRTKSVEAINDVKWFPAESVNRITAMVSGRPDWCLSRQRAWGVGIPVFYYKGQPVLTQQSVRAVYEMTLEHGSDAWYEREPRDILPPDFVCPHGGDVSEYTKETDVLDVWFDSGSTCRAVLDLRPELSFPADVYLEGSDQHRGWFNSSLMVGVATKGVAPYRQVITCGWMLDEKGKAMHKSAGNALAPSVIIDEYGADVLRLWVASVNYFEDVRFGPNIVKQTAESYRRIRNTLRYLLGALYDFRPGHDTVSPDDLTNLDKWALDRLQTLTEECVRGYENYEFARVTRAVNDFCATDMSAFYLDVLKDRLYANAPNDRARRSSQTAMHEIAHVLTRLVAPILSHTAEEVWQMLPGATDASPSVELSVFPDVEPLFVNADLRERWRVLLGLRDQVNRELDAVRKSGAIKKSLEAKVTLVGDWDAARGFDANDLETIFLVSQVVRDASADETNVIVGAADGSKCPRCWLVRRDIGTNLAHSDICGRCADAVSQVIAASAK